MGPCGSPGPHLRHTMHCCHPPLSPAAALAPTSDTPCTAATHLSALRQPWPPPQTHHALLPHTSQPCGSPGPHLRHTMHCHTHLSPAAALAPTSDTPCTATHTDHTDYNTT